MARQTAAAILATASLSLMMACGTPRPPLPPSLELPKPVTDLRGARKGDTVHLVWTVPAKTMDNTNLHHLGPTLICRSLEVAINRCDPVGVIQPADLPQPGPLPPTKASEEKKNSKRRAAPASVVTATFTDPLSQVLEQKDPAGFVTYAVESQNLNLRSAGLSNQIQIPLAPTLPPPGGLEAQLTSEGVVLTWEGELPTHQDPGVSYLYRVYRREKASKAVSLAGEVAVSIAAQPRFLDNGFEWQKTYEYWVAVTSVVSRSLKAVLQVEGENSPVVTIFANDTYPPAAPVGLQAVASGVGQKPFIDLAWAPNTEPDLAGYNVYGREGDGAWNKMNDRPLTTPTFRDSRVISGKTYSYAISAIDPRGNESPRSEETTETIP